MKRIHLKDFAKVRGQPEAASLLSVTQGALSKAIRLGREVLVTEHVDGTFTAIETRSFPSRIDRSKDPSIASTMNHTIPPSVLVDESGDTSDHPYSVGGVHE